ncbi:hypothetical protein QAD02_006717 [Eretmocerus hayati]|uniref:Uncharacterized protein n=1 Tax=Eretmocerus hayati TaxID=131215 RepID=A0ACC2N5Y2_9HYME|nr:hypothetical protein QAD02_006717 [Eretmocerus hayati]
MEGEVFDSTRLLINSFAYARTTRSKKSTFWRCVKYNPKTHSSPCPATASTQNINKANGKVVVTRGPNRSFHNHSPDPEHIKWARKEKCQIKSKRVQDSISSGECSNSPLQSDRILSSNIETTSGRINAANRTTANHLHTSHSKETDDLGTNTKDSESKLPNICVQTKELMKSDSCSSNTQKNEYDSDNSRGINGLTNSAVSSSASSPRATSSSNIKGETSSKISSIERPISDDPSIHRGSTVLDAKFARQGRNTHALCDAPLTFEEGNIVNEDIIEPPLSVSSSSNNVSSSVPSPKPVTVSMPCVTEPEAHRVPCTAISPTESSTINDLADGKTDGTRETLVTKEKTGNEAMLQILMSSFQTTIKTVQHLAELITEKEESFLSQNAEGLSNGFTTDATQGTSPDSTPTDAHNRAPSPMDQ